MVSGYIRHSQTNNNIYFGCSLIVTLKFELLRLFMLHHFYPVLKRLATVFFASHSFNQPTNTSFPSSSPSEWANDRSQAAGEAEAKRENRCIDRFARLLSRF